MSAEIEQPVAGSHAKVVLNGAGPAGTIRTWGTTSNTWGTTSNKRSLDAKVRVKVWSGHITTPPNNPPPDTDIPVVNDEWNGYVAVPSSSASQYTAYLTMFVWDMYGSGPAYPYTYVWFYGLQSSVYDFAQASKGASAAVVSYAPLVWMLELSGIEAPLQRLNDSWELTLQETASQDSVWSNGGDGVNSPKIELFSCGPANPRWCLRIHFGGDEFEYSAPETWHAVSELQLTAVNGRNVPTTLRVKPA